MTLNRGRAAMAGLAALAAGCCLLAPAAATAQESHLVSEFRRFCLETDSDPAKALALADQAGWGPTAEFVSEDGEGREITDGDGRRVLWASSVVVENVPPVFACGLSVERPSPEAVLGEVTALVGVAPREMSVGEDAITTWTFVEGPEGRRPIGPAESIPDLLRTTGVHTILLGASDGKTVLGHSRIGPQ